MPYIVIQPGETIRILEGNTQKLKITMLWGKQGGGLPTASAFAILAVYDLDLYMQHQADLKKAAGDVGFFETSERFFRTTNQPLPSPPPDHRVAPGTGVMLQARLRFGFSDDPTKTANSHFFVTQFQTEGDNSPKPYALDVHVLGRFNAAGQPITGGKVELRSIGKASVARSDFDNFFKFGIAADRKIAVRVFKSSGGASTGVNELSQVLLSSLDKDQSSTSRGPDGVAKHDALHTRLRLSRSLITPRNVGDPAPTPQRGGAQPSRLRKPDLTGYYVEEVKQKINAQGVREIDPISVVSPSTLYIHEAGHATVAWYSPLPNGTLASKDAGFGFDSDIVKGMLSERGRLVFVGPMLQLPSELQGKVPANMPLGATPMLYFDDKASSSPLELDPVDILRRKKEATPVQVGWMRLISDSLSFRAVEFGLESGRKAEFQFIHSGTRLSWEVIKLLRKSAQVNALPESAFIKDTLKDDAAPLPPAVSANLVKKLIDGKMFDALKAISELPPKGDIAKRLLAEDRIIKIVDSVVAPLKQHQRANFRVMAQTTMRSHSFFFASDGEDKSVFERLVTVATNIFERQNPKQSVDAKVAEFVPASFRTLGIHPEAGFRYKLDFTSKAISGGTFLQGSAGGFLLEITREVELPRANPTDKPKFAPDPTFDAEKNSATAKYFGAFLGGGVGFSAGIGIKGGETGGGGSGEPLSCEIITFHQINARQFDRSTFNTASFVRPGFGIAGGPVTFSSSSHDSVMTVRISEEVQITGKVNTPLIEPKVDAPTKEGIFNHYKKWHEALKNGDLEAVPAASANATLAALTASWGILFKRDTPLQEVPKPDKEKEVPEPTNLNVDQTIGAVHFDRGSSTIDEASHRTLDACLATARQLFELEGWLVLFAGASPQYGRLNRSDSQAQNFQLAKFRADTTKQAIFASLGEPGGGIIPKDKEVQDGIDVDSAIRTTLAPAPGTTDVTMLDPFGDVAKTAEGKQVVQREERDIYKRFQRCDIIVAGLLAVRLPSR